MTIGRSWPEKLTLFQDLDAFGVVNIFIVNRASPVALPVAEAEPLKDQMRAFITCRQTGNPFASDIEALNVIVFDQMQTALIDTNHLQD